MAYHLVRMVFSCAGKKLQNNRGTSLEASQFFFKLLLALLVSHAGAPTNASADRFQYSICAGIGWVSCVSLPACMLQLIAFMLFEPWAVCLVSLYRFHAVWVACKPFSVLPSRSSQFSNRSARFINDTLYNESGPTSLKTG